MSRRKRATDRYCRTVARVECDGTDASAEQVRAGMAWVFDRYVTDRGLYAVQDDARAGRRGLWGDAAPVAPWDWRQRSAAAPAADQSTRISPPAGPTQLTSGVASGAIAR